MDQQQIKGLADRFITRLHQVEKREAGSIAGMVEMFADDAELVNSMMQHGPAKGMRCGRGEIEQFWREYSESFRNIASEFNDVTTSDHSAGLFWQASGADKTGRPVQYEGVSLLELDDSGKIARFKAYFDSRQLERPQAGQD